MKMTANGVCDFCSQTNSPIFALPETLQQDIEATVVRVSRPATKLLHVVMIGGVTAGVVLGATMLVQRMRKR